MVMFWGFISGKAQNVNAIIKESGVLITEENDFVLFYNTKNKTNYGLDSRSNFIHPLYGLNGEVITENYPVDHLHHRGVFWAWHQIYIGNLRVGDAWYMDDFKYEVDSVWIKNDSNSAKTICSKVLWKSPMWIDDNKVEKPLIQENTSITVYKKSATYRIIDLTISLLALEENVKIGGSEDAKGYGGFSYRIKLAQDMKFTCFSGDVEPNNLPVKAGNWLDVSGPIGYNNKVIGLSVLCHKDNPSPADQWILRKTRSMQNAVFPYPGAQAVSLSVKNPTVLKYRLVIHNGYANDVDLSTIYKNYIE